VETPLATNLALDQELLDRAFRVSGEPTKKAAITQALQEFIARPPFWVQIRCSPQA
jgi:hypothetical protein